MAGKLIDGDGLITLRDWINSNIKAVANPTIPSGTTPTVLTSLKIGDSYFIVPGGGGGDYVPYTGATADVNLGTHTLNANYFAITSNPSDLSNVTILSKTYIQYLRTVNNVPKIATFHFPDKIGDPIFAMVSDIKKMYWHTITITEDSYGASFSFQSMSATPLDSIDALNVYFNTFKFVSGSYYEPGSTQFATPNTYLLSSVNKATGNNVGKFEIAFKSGLNTFTQSHFFSSAATVSDVVEEA